MAQRPYQNVKLIRQAVFKLPHSQAISCIRYNVNLQTGMVAILILVEFPKSIAFDRGLSGIKVISKCEVNPTSTFQLATAFTHNILYRVKC